MGQLLSRIVVASAVYRQFEEKRSESASKMVHSCRRFILYRPFPILYRLTADRPPTVAVKTYIVASSVVCLALNKVSREVVVCLPVVVCEAHAGARDVIIITVCATVRLGTDDTGVSGGKDKSVHA